MFYVPITSSLELNRVLDPSILWIWRKRERLPRIGKRNCPTHTYITHSPHKPYSDSMQPQQAALADDEKLLQMLYCSLKRAIAPLHETAGPDSPRTPTPSPQIIPLLSLVVLDDKGHDETLLLTQNHPLSQKNPLTLDPALQTSSINTGALASHLNQELHLAMQADIPLGARAYEISQAALCLRIALMESTGVGERDTDTSRGPNMMQQHERLQPQLQEQQQQSHQQPGVAASEGSLASDSLMQRKRLKTRQSEATGNCAGQGQEEGDENDEDEWYHRNKGAKPLSPVDFKMVVGVLFSLHILVTQGPLNLVLFMVAYLVMSAVVKMLLAIMS